MSVPKVVHHHNTVGVSRTLLPTQVQTEPKMRKFGVFVQILFSDVNLLLTLGRVEARAARPRLDSGHVCGFPGGGSACSLLCDTWPYPAVLY